MILYSRTAKRGKREIDRAHQERNHEIWTWFKFPFSRRIGVIYYLFLTLPYLGTKLFPSHAGVAKLKNPRIISSSTRRHLSFPLSEDHSNSLGAILCHSYLVERQLLNRKVYEKPSRYTVELRDMQRETDQIRRNINDT